MTPEEFVYWLSGYVSAIDDRVKVPNENDWARIKSSLAKVNQKFNSLGIAQQAKQLGLSTVNC